jgi:hypothetical protein
MKRKIIYIFFILCINTIASAQSFSKYKENKTPTYNEVISAYKTLDAEYVKAKLIEYGPTDCGKHLHLFVISNSGVFNPDQLRKNNLIYFVNNGIHPGEPDGIDASIVFAEDILSGKIALPLNVVVIILPLYNIDGALNRGCCSRASQNGPEEYGFRANGQNLDLNRDFIKMDATNTISFEKLFREWNPDLFIDTHVSDGADYPYVITLIDTQKDKLNHYLSNYIQGKFLPQLRSKMKEAGFPVSPYVNAWSATPDKGFEGFLETPRYATGYAALFNTPSFVVETHMLKPYYKRVESIYEFLKSSLAIAASDRAEIKQARAKADDEVTTMKNFALQWKADTVHYDSILFNGYEPKYKISNLTGLQRLYYDTTAPYEKYIHFYDNFNVTADADRPEAYIIPQAWSKIIEKMKINKVEMQQFKTDTDIIVSSYYISGYKSAAVAFEGHHLNTEVVTEKRKQQLHFLKGDYIIFCNQSCNRYIVETLEPKGVDSWFTWGFFDAILQQKEWYSDYIFIDEAEKMVEENAGLKNEFEDKKRTEPAFAANQNEMLTWLYRHSKYYEAEHNRYPVYRIE